MIIILTQILLFVGILVSLWLSVSALTAISALSKATESTFEAADKHITDLANNDAILANAIDQLIENLSLNEDEIYEDKNS